jgi:hypothetical protein
VDDDVVLKFLPEFEVEAEVSRPVVSTTPTSSSSGAVIDIQAASLGLAADAALELRPSIVGSWYRTLELREQPVNDPRHLVGSSSTA